jgi:hypothetical protein
MPGNAFERTVGHRGSELERLIRLTVQRSNALLVR